MRSETIKGELNAWKKFPIYLVVLSFENPFLFDYVKFEIMRAEIDTNSNRDSTWVLWDNKFRPPELRKAGCISGLLYECVHLGSLKYGREKSSDPNAPKHQENIFSISPSEIYMAGR